MARRKKVNISLYEYLMIIVVFAVSIYANYSSSSKADIISTAENLEVHFMDVGQADAILVRCKNENMLIDAGNNEDRGTILKYLDDLSIKKFKYVFATHAHEDHIGAMDDVIDNYEIENFFMPDVVSTTKTFENVLDSLDAKNYKYITPKIGDTYKLCEANIEVLSIGDEVDNLNNTSIVLRLTNGNNSFLFMGDAEVEVEKRILNNNINAQVLKVGHHGSVSSSHAAFIKKVAPKYAIISVGKNNKYGHPDSIILNRLKLIGSEIYRTDISGTIVLESDGNVFKVKTEK